MRLKIRIDTIDKVKEFSALAMKFNVDIDVINDRYVVDAKSIMGLFSIDLAKTLEMEIHSDDCSIRDAFSKFIV